LGQRRWIQLFRMVGFISDSAGTTRPDHQLLVYRGATRRRRRRMSWTTNREKAQWFADRYSRAAGGDPVVHYALALDATEFGLAEPGRRWLGSGSQPFHPTRSWR
jgi:hypothetical protein